MKASVLSLVLLTMLAIVSAEEHEDLAGEFEKELLDAIKGVDLDNDGFINLEEYMKGTNTTVDYLPNQFDTDEDGRYSYEEFINAYIELVLGVDEE